MVASLGVEEIRALLPIAEKGYREMYQRTLDKDHFLQSWSMLIENQAGQILVVHNDEDVQGFLGYCLSDNLFEPEDTIEVLFLYILPQYRGQAVLGELMEHLAEKGLPVEVALMDDQYRTAMGKWGYRPQVVIYRRDCE